MLPEKTTNSNSAHRPKTKRGFALLIIFLLLGIPCLSYGQGLLRLSTYFPAPFGTFNQLRIVPGANPASCVGRDGLIWINAAGELKMCMGGFAVVPSGIWEQDRATNKVYLTDLSTGANPLLKVGIGTITAATKLHVLSTTNTPIRLDSDAAVPNVGMDMYEGINKRGGMISSNIHALSIQNNLSAGQFDIGQLGFVGIGASVLPTYSINMVGDITAQGQFIGGVADTTNSIAVLYGSALDEGGQINLELAADHDGGGFNRWTVDSYQDDLRIFRDDAFPGPYPGGLSLFIDQAGNAAFGGVPNAGNKLTVRGDMYVSNGGTGQITYGAMFYISDKAAKDHIRPVKGLDIISRLHGVKYTLKATGKESVGLIAQDVEKILPELVATASGTDIKGVQYGNIIAPLIEAIKEQQAQIKQLKKEIESLKEKRF